MEIERLNYLTEKAQGVQVYENDPEAINLAELVRRTEAGTDSSDWEVITQTRIGDFISILKRFRYDEEGGKVSVIINNKGSLSESQYSFEDAFKWHGEAYLETEEKDPYKAYISSVGMISKDKNGALGIKGNIGLMYEYKALFEVLHPQNRMILPRIPESSSVMISTPTVEIGLETDGVASEAETPNDAAIKSEDELHIVEPAILIEEQPQEVLGNSETTDLERQLKEANSQIVFLQNEISYLSRDIARLTDQVENFNQIEFEQEIEYAPPAVDELEMVDFEPNSEAKEKAESVLFNGAVKREDGKFVSPKDNLTKVEREEVGVGAQNTEPEAITSLNIYDLENGMRIGFPRMLRSKNDIFVKVNEQINLFDPLIHDLGWLEDEIRKIVKGLRSSYTRDMLAQVKLIPPETHEKE